MSKSLVIVESPAKARTIARFLGSDYIVDSSIGHIRDLPRSAEEIPAAYKKEPWARLGIDVAGGFKPLYVVPKEKREQVAKLKALMKDADAVLLATDEDREGESISWHLKEVLQPRVPIRRLVFHEITDKAIREAVRTPRDIEQRLVQAQETRRILDRLFGYEVSPVLWKKIAKGLSAGRVQSVAVRMIVERERARMRFHKAEYWDLLGEFGPEGQGAFTAELVTVGGRRLAVGKDFDELTGRLKGGANPPLHLAQADAEALRTRLADESWRVAKMERRPFTQQPPPPFITSTLQQEANRKLRFGSQRTMKAAQGLYEQGYITYMRTDSTTLSDQALQAARNQIRERYGAENLPDAPRIYRAKVRNAQEAHEAIRPAGEAFRLPESVRGELDDDLFRLYEMIWKRTVASQMLPARGQRVTLQVQAADAVFQATGKVIEFPGFLRAYVEGSDDPEAELGDQEKILPELKAGDPVTCRGLNAQQHFTQPPARFSEASLIKELEKEGVGRPSTYASIINTIIERNYVSRKAMALVPTFTAFAVVQLLERYFAHLVDLGFTARMEETLDAISRGERESLPYLKEFYFGTDTVEGLTRLLEADIDARAVSTIPLLEDAQGRAINVRVGRFGPFLERDGETASIPPDTTPDELTLEMAEALLAGSKEPHVLGTDPDSGRPVYLKTGRFGPYVQLGDREEGGAKPKMKSLAAGQVPAKVTLEDALQLLSLPRDIGPDPKTGEPIVVDLGRYGPYARRGSDNRSLPSADWLFSATPAQVSALFDQPKGPRRGQATVLRTVGEHPETAAPINLMDGRYGPYVTDGELNASLHRTQDPAELTLEQAVALLRERAEKGGATKGRRRNTPRKGAATKAKAPARKAGAKRSSGASTAGTRRKTTRRASG